jgi:hypothetical protein
VPSSIVTKDGVLNVARESYEEARAEKSAARTGHRDMILHRLSDGLEVSIDPSWVGLMMDGDQRAAAEVHVLRPLDPAS